MWVKCIPPSFGLVAAFFQYSPVYIHISLVLYNAKDTWKLYRKMNHSLTLHSYALYKTNMLEGEKLWIKLDTGAFEDSGNTFSTYLQKLKVTVYVMEKCLHVASTIQIPAFSFTSSWWR